MHRTVLLNETCDLLAPALAQREESYVIDGTFGGGGHSRELLARFPKLKIIGIDQDPAVISDGAPDRVSLRRGRFGGLESLVPERPIAGILADLGFSSLQMDDPSRGLSFKEDGPLDMRLDPTQGKPVSERLLELSQEELAQILIDYGQERFARSMAREIIAAVRHQRLNTTAELVRAALPGVPRGARHGRIHFATRLFQALRIWVNDELGELDRLLTAAPKLLAPGGRLAVISFHSLEDGRVKRAFKLTPWKVVTQKPIAPSEAEAHENPRARSAKLRCAEVPA